MAQAQTETVLKALAEPSRVVILSLTRARELPAGEIASHFGTTRPAVSQHLRVLKRAGLVSERRSGTRRLYRLDLGGLAALRAYLDSFWEEALAAFKVAAEDGGRSS